MISSHTTRTQGRTGSVGPSLSQTFERRQPTKPRSENVDIKNKMTAFLTARRTAVEAGPGEEGAGADVVEGGVKRARHQLGEVAMGELASSSASGNAPQPGAKAKAKGGGGRGGGRGGRGGGGTAGKGGGGGGQPTSLPPRYRDLMTQVLANARNIAVQQALTTWTFIINSNSNIAKASKDVGRQYHEQTNGVPNHGMGSPHLHTFNCWITEMKLAVDDHTLPPEAGTTIQQFEEKYCIDFHTLGEAVKEARCGKSNIDGKSKLTVGLTQANQEICAVLRAYLELEESEMKVGINPKNPRERRLEEWLRPNRRTANGQEGAETTQEE